MKGSEFIMKKCILFTAVFFIVFCTSCRNKSDILSNESQCYKSGSDVASVENASDIYESQNATDIGNQSAEPSSSTETASDTKKSVPETTPLSKSDALKIANDLVERYHSYIYFGTTCDLIENVEDMSGIISEKQKQNYFGFQYECTCCKSMEQVHNHISKCISAELVKNYPDDMMFLNKGRLFILVPPETIEAYENIKVVSYNEDHIIATADVVDIDGICGTISFDIVKKDSGYIVSAVSY